MTLEDIITQTESTSVFTEEQEAEIQKRIQTNIEREHIAFACDRFFRDALPVIAQYVQNGTEDIEVLRFGQVLENWARAQYPFMRAKKPEPPKKQERE